MIGTINRQQGLKNDIGCEKFDVFSEWSCLTFNSKSKKWCPVFNPLIEKKRSFVSNFKRFDRWFHKKSLFKKRPDIIKDDQLNSFSAMTNEADRA